MNLQSVVLLGVVIAVAGAVLRYYIRKQKRTGGCGGCNCCGCTSCPSRH